MFLPAVRGWTRPSQNGLLMVGTDTGSDGARADSGYRARNAWEHKAGKEEKDKEKANRVAQQVKRAAALTAELAARSEQKVSVGCDHPPRFRDEQVEYVVAPDMVAGFSHPQAAMMREDKGFFPLSASSLVPADEGFFSYAGRFRGGQPTVSHTSTRSSSSFGRRDATLLRQVT